MRGVLSILSAAMLLTGCIEPSSDQSAFKLKRPEGEKEYCTTSGKKIFMSETHPRGKNFTTVRIRTEGFQRDVDMTLDDLNPVQEVFFSDLDDDGFNELILATATTDGKMKGDIVAFTSYKDRGLMDIGFPEIRTVQLYPSGDFGGYRGQDDFDVEMGRLTRTFPMYQRGTDNIIGQRKAFYTLESDENGYFFELERVEKTMNSPTASR